MTSPSESPAQPPRSQVAQLFARALAGEEGAEIELHRVAFGIPSGGNTAVDEAQRALATLGGPRPDGACPEALRGAMRRAWATSYSDQLRAEMWRRTAASS